MSWWRETEALHWLLSRPLAPVFPRGRQGGHLQRVLHPGMVGGKRGEVSEEFFQEQEKELSHYAA